MFQHVAAERVVRPEGGGGHHRLRPVSQGHVPDGHGRPLGQRPQRHENRLTLHTRLRLRQSDIERAVDTDRGCRTGDERCCEDGDGSRPVRPCRRCLLGQGGAHDVFFRRCRLEAASWRLLQEGALQQVPSTPPAGCVEPATRSDRCLPELRRLTCGTGRRRLAGFCSLPGLTRARAAEVAERNDLVAGRFPRVESAMRDTDALETSTGRVIAPTARRDRNPGRSGRTEGRDSA